MKSSSPQTISLQEISAALWRGRWLVVLGSTLGVALALSLSWILPPRYEAVTTVVLRDRLESGGTPSLGGGALGGGGSRGGSDDGGSSSRGVAQGLQSFLSLPNVLGGGVSTEIEILASRDLVRRMARQIGLPVTVLKPRRLPADSLFESIEIVGFVERRGIYRFTREGSGFRVKGSYGVDQTVAPGVAVEVPGAVLRLRQTPLPSSFKIRVEDLEETVERIARQSVLDRILQGSAAEVSLAAGDIAQVHFSARDRWTAAAAANAVVELYLADREGRRALLQVEREALLALLADSVADESARAVTSYREYQESRSRFDPERLGDEELIVVLREQADALDMELGVVNRLLEGSGGDSLAPGIILGVGAPSLSENLALQSLLNRLYLVRAQRASLLELRTERDSEVQALNRSIEFLMGELEQTMVVHRASLREQLVELGSELQEYRDIFSSLPAEEAAIFSLESEMERLTATFVSVQAQLVQARLTALGQGRDLRQIDVATPPRRPEFPSLPLNVLLGILVGMFVGVSGALLQGAVTNRVFDVNQLRAVTDLPVATTDARGSLLLMGLEEVRSVLILPLGEAASATRVARWLAEAIAVGSGRASLLDLANGVSAPAVPSPGHLKVVEAGVENAYHEFVAEAGESGGKGVVPHSWAQSVGDLEEREGPLVIAVSGIAAPVARTLLDPERPVILSIEHGASALSDVAEATTDLERFGFTVAGIVLTRT